MKLLEVTKIWNQGRHNAFTDLCSYNNQYFCCFREASAHISRIGIIRILISDDLNNWRLISTVRSHLCDLRDPKLSISFEGKLTLSYLKVTFNEIGQNQTSYNCISSSYTGTSWSQPQVFADNNWWLWRICWFKKEALGIGYNHQAGCVRLYRGDPNRTFSCIDDNLFGLARYQKGYPNESDIVFLSTGEAVCILRRDADSASAQLGLSHPPYTQWKWHDLGCFVGGPALIISNNDKVLLAGRSWNKKQGAKTQLWQVNLDQKLITPLMTLPSAGDTSYPGLVIADNKLYVSYYSSHQQNKSSIFLAKIKIN